MKTLQKIVIKDVQKKVYQSIITLGVLGEIKYCVNIKTNYKGVVNVYIQKYDTYKEALNQYLEDVKEYAYHTAIMNF